MKQLIFLLLLSASAFGRRLGLIDADTTTRPKTGLHALAFNNGKLRIVRSSGSSYEVLTGNQTYTNPSWLTSILSAKISDFSAAVATTATLKANNLSDLANAGTARNNLGGTTVGSNLFTLTNPGAIRFLRLNADNTVSALDASAFLSAIGAGSSSGTVSSVALSLPAALFSISGSPVTGAGTLTGTFASQTANTFLAAPDGSSGTPAMRAIVVADLPTGIDAAKIGGGAVSNTEFSYLDGVGSAIQTQIDSKAATSHTHAISGVTALQDSITNKVNKVAGKGLSTNDYTDAEKTKMPQTVVLTSDVVNSDVTPNTLADVTGLSFPVVSGGIYKFRFFITYTSAATTTGSRWTINGPAATVSYNSNYTLAATTQTLNQAIAAYNLPANASASSIIANNVAIIDGVISASASGDVIARFASEITASAITAKAGLSYVEYTKIN